jgi:tetratricopeptide (TPR) repeat protein
MKKAMIWISLFIFAAGAGLASVSKANGYWKKGKKAWDKGNVEEAISLFVKGTQENPQDGDIYRWLGFAYAHNSQNKEAIEALNQSLLVPHSKSGEPETWKQLAASHAELKQFDSAISAIKKYIELKPDDAEGFIGLTYLSIRSKQYDDAIMAAKRAIEIKPDSAPAHYVLGIVHRERREISQAFAAVNKAIDLEPKNAAYRDRLGDLFHEKGKYLEASEAYRKAVELEPDNSEFLWELADSCRMAGKYGDAITFIGKAIEIESRSGFPSEKAYFFAMRSNAYRHKGNLEMAIQDAEKAFSLNPTSTYVQISRGAIDLVQGKFDQALKLLTQFKNSPGARVLAATAYAKQGRYAEAEEICASIREGSDSLNKNVPFHEDLKALLIEMKPYSKERRTKARAYESKGLHREALLEYVQALRTADEEDARMIRDSLFEIARLNPSAAELPEEARRNVLRAEMLVKEGSFEKAAAEYRQAIRLAPYAARLYFNAALVLAELKNFPEAIRHMNLYIQAAPEATDARAAKDQVIKWEFLLEKER